MTLIERHINFTAGGLGFNGTLRIKTITASIRRSHNYFLTCFGLFDSSVISLWCFNRNRNFENYQTPDKRNLDTFALELRKFILCLISFSSMGLDTSSSATLLKHVPPVAHRQGFPVMAQEWRLGETTLQKIDRQFYGRPQTVAAASRRP